MSVDTMFPGDSELASLMRSKDWSKTPLGPVESWPPKPAPFAACSVSWPKRPDG